MRATPAVSVLMPVRNAAAWLGEALDSLAAQTLGDFEVVAVDDHSTDATRRILEQRAVADERIRVFETSDDQAGLVAALNLGLDRLRGRCVARMDGDDVAHPERLADQLRHLERDAALAAVACEVEGFPPASLGEGMQRYLEWQNGLVEPAELHRDRFVESPVVAPSLMIRTEFLRDTLGGWQDHGWPEDWDLVLRAFEAGARIARVPRVLQRWRQHDAQATRSDSRYSVDALLRARAHYLARHLRAAAGGRAVWLLGAGPVGKTLAEALDGAGFLVSGFAEVDPRKIGNRVRRGARRWPVVSSDALLGAHASSYAVAAVGLAGARERIRAWLTAHGWVEERDFVAAA